MGIYLESAYKTPLPDGSFDPRVWDLAKYFATFSGNGLVQVHDLDGEVLASVAEALSSREISVRPVSLEAMVMPNRFAFRAICKKKQAGETSRLPCMALVELKD